MSLDIGLYMNVNTGGKEPLYVSVGDLNITHNLTPMWRYAGVYDALYNSHDDKARQHIDVLELGLKHMQENKDEYTPMNPSNGWGDYDSALRFLEKWLDICKQHPDMLISVWK